MIHHFKEHAPQDALLLFVDKMAEVMQIPGRRAADFLFECVCFDQLAHKAQVPKDFFVGIRSQKEAWTRLMAYMQATAERSMTNREDA